MTQARQVRDPRDKIYGLLSLVKNKNSLPYLPTYDIDARTLYRDIAVHAIVQSQELRLLEVCETNESSLLGQLILGSDLVSQRITYRLTHLGQRPFFVQQAR